MSSTLGPWLRRFLTEYIVTERNLARNTQKSYRDTFALLLPFVGAKIRKPIDRLAVQDLTARRVLQFLARMTAPARRRPATSGRFVPSPASSVAATFAISSGARISARSHRRRQRRN